MMGLEEVWKRYRGGFEGVKKVRLEMKKGEMGVIHNGDVGG